MNIWNISTKLLIGSVFYAAIAGAANAQTCEGILTPLAPEEDEFANTLFQFNWADIAVEVPKWEQQGTETLVKATISFEVEIDGTLYYTNQTGAPCTANWTLDVDFDASSSIPLADFPISEEPGTGGQFLNAPVGIEVEQSNEFLNELYTYEFKDLDAQAFVANNPGEMITFLTDVSADYQAFGCAPQDQRSRLNARVKVIVDYVVCEVGGGGGSGCICVGPSPHYRKPGSLLLYPEFDNREGDMTLITITNVDCEGTSSDVDVEFVFIDERDCSEFNTTITLTPCDTFTAITNFVNPNMEQGYFYAFAKNSDGEAITHNGLIGSSMVISGIEQFDYQVNPVAFLGMTAEGNPTDLDGDDVRDLDGVEYDHAPDTITVPRFLGQGVDAQGEGAPINSHLILIGLSGGQDFTTTICFDVYNDNEEPFSGEYTFYCWEKPTLLQVRGTFANSFLRTTDHDPNEILGASNRRESGWICIDGCFATSQQETIVDPAFYAVLVERISSYSVSDLPFECGRQSNGALLPRGLFGDGDPIAVNGDNQ